MEPIEGNIKSCDIRSDVRRARKPGVHTDKFTIVGRNTWGPLFRAYFNRDPESTILPGNEPQNGCLMQMVYILISRRRSETIRR